VNSEDLKRRTKQFAHKCIKLTNKLPQTKLGSHIQGQIIRCSTSVAAHYRAVCLAQSKASFISKISIVLEEIDESLFWLEFILEEKFLDEKEVMPLVTEANELTAIFYASRKTARLSK